MRRQIISVLVLSLVLPLMGQKGIQIVIRSPQGEKVELYRNSYALVVGIGKYIAGWPQLQNAQNDALEVKKALEMHGFEVTLLVNPSADELKKSIENFIAKQSANVDDRVVFYFSGHGYTDKKSYGGEVGYIVPVDAPNPNIDKSDFLLKAISMENFFAYARNINAKHALFIFDSCFSGTVFSMAKSVPAAISYKTSLPVREFITAGTAHETVPDESIFRQQLVTALAGSGDTNGDGYITGSELGEYLHTTVINYSRNTQHPQFGKIREANLDKGDFVFVCPQMTIKKSKRTATNDSAITQALIPQNQNNSDKINIKINNSVVARNGAIAISGGSNSVINNIHNENVTIVESRKNNKHNFSQTSNRFLGLSDPPQMFKAESSIGIEGGQTELPNDDAPEYSLTTDVQKVGTEYILAASIPVWERKMIFSDFEALYFATVKDGIILRNETGEKISKSTSDVWQSRLGFSAMLYKGLFLETKFTALRNFVTEEDLSGSNLVWQKNIDEFLGGFKLGLKTSAPETSALQLIPTLHFGFGSYGNNDDREDVFQYGLSLELNSGRLYARKGITDYYGRTIGFELLKREFKYGNRISYGVFLLGNFGRFFSHLYVRRSIDDYGPKAYHLRYGFKLGSRF